ncbi:hypothetical protein F2P81_023226 [Scophthalmus maximus]|uniref:Uncharacterized protein n=1 Tax=Scophthalmus maximus TaxID=52904 RepID=A0A6A4S1P0_SCOMX|nr:hypothetical protein F2P81_023226 [Scophthalmus maximus]
MSNAKMNTTFRDGENPELMRLDMETVKCPFCHKTGGYPELIAHLQGHQRSALKYGGYNIYKCHLGCVASSHYHCSSCPRVIVKKDSFLNHFKTCCMATATRSVYLHPQPLGKTRPRKNTPTAKHGHCSYVTLQNTPKELTEKKIHEEEDEEGNDAKAKVTISINATLAVWRAAITIVARAHVLFDHNGPGDCGDHKGPGNCSDKDGSGADPDDSGACSDQDGSSGDCSDQGGSGDIPDCSGACSDQDGSSDNPDGSGACSDQDGSPSACSDQDNYSNRPCFHSAKNVVGKASNKNMLLVRHKTPQKEPQGPHSEAPHYKNSSYNGKLPPAVKVH